VTRIYEEARPAPTGLILQDYIEDVEIGLLKSGKEADVYVMERRASDRSCLLAAKRFRPSEHRGFRNDMMYRAHRRNDGLVRDHGDRRKRVAGRNIQKAMDQRSNTGRKALAEQWIATEWSMLKRLWDAGVSVPYALERLDDGILMQYLGDEGGAAPRLTHAHVSRDVLEGLFEQLREEMRLIARAGIVHGDLSAYNLLFWDERLWVIDLPQAVPLLDNMMAMDLMHRDCVNVVTWFARKGLDADPEDLFVALLNEVFDYQMEDMFRAH
jgi:RIO kinase 1